MASALVGLAGCSGGIPGFGGPSKITLPKLTDGWAALQESGEMELIFGFAGEVENVSGVSLPKDQIAEQIAPAGMTLDPQPIDLPGANSIPKSHRLEGVARRDGGLGKESVGPWPHYDVTGFSVVTQQTTVEVPDTGQTVDVTVPVESPPDYHVFSPKGYPYLLPKDDRIVARNASRLSKTVDRPWKGLFTYDGEPPATTIPNIRHTVLPDAGWMRMVDEYRVNLINQLLPLYQEETYNENAYRSVRNASSNLSEELLKHSLESVLFYKVPGWISVPMDLEGIHKNLRGTHNDFQDAFQAIGRQQSFALDNTIFRHLDPDKRGQGLEVLSRRAEFNYRLHNPLMTSSRSVSAVKKWAEVYKQSLQKQREELKRIFQKLVGANYGSEYTKEIGVLGKESIRQMVTLVSRETQILSEMS
jgi:hypothetical protein